MIFVPPKDLSFEEVEEAIINLVCHALGGKYQLKPHIEYLQLGSDEYRALKKGPFGGNVFPRLDDNQEEYIEIITAYGKMKCYNRPGRS